MGTCSQRKLSLWIDLAKQQVLVVKVKESKIPVVKSRTCWFTIEKYVSHTCGPFALFLKDSIQKKWKSTQTWSWEQLKLQVCTPVWFHNRRHQIAGTASTGWQLGFQAESSALHCMCRGVFSSWFTHILCKLYIPHIHVFCCDRIPHGNYLHEGCGCRSVDLKMTGSG